MINITALNKIYKSKKRKHCHALKDVNLTLPDAGLVFVLGKSGSGKSTLLNLIGGLDNLSGGRPCRSDEKSAVSKDMPPARSQILAG